MKESNKKILFICGSLGNGNDGVGDYTLTLAKQLDKMGHNISIIALNDKYLSQNNYIKENIADINILRIHHTLHISAKKSLIKSFLTLHNPRFISLQFVPFAFQNKGLPINLLFLLNSFEDLKWHIMFHELWAGMEINDSYRLKILGYLQKKIIHYLIFKLQPFAIHTSNTLYIHQLKKVTKLYVSKLPLFGNIEKNEYISVDSDKKKNSES
ncbi:hypothetical protein [Pedobacter sp. SL55]|uniref:hypothetical protein n=1 Tax=Pedobacter sp. SL55 TaxID=2995161 RepID=UPI00226FDB06|nr:hypothetical protein [Pedobacter sp. SL55]WAC39054.1 hypothetical protein OVA16_10550 [Pedobacter sp. SL55]